MNLTNSPNVVSCTHTTPIWYSYELVEVGLFGETELQNVQRGGEWTYEDVDIGRFICTQCGLIKYYTGHWKKYYEEGIPCSGSEGVSREIPEKFKRLIKS